MATPQPEAAGSLAIEGLFPLALGRFQCRPDPLDLAAQLQQLHELRGEAEGNPEPGCAWTGDLNGVWQLHRHPTFAPLIAELTAHIGTYLEQLGFDRRRISLHLQRCWPVLSEPGQEVGRHHHPNAHLTAIYYLSGDGSGRCGSLRLWPLRQANELVPGFAVGHGGPLTPTSWTRPWLDVAPRAGLLLVFPACIDHAVLPNGDPESLRCSLSMDLVLTAAPLPAGQAPPEYLAPHPSQWQAITEDGLPPA